MGDDIARIIKGTKRRAQQKDEVIEIDSTHKHSQKVGCFGFDVR